MESDVLDNDLRLGLQLLHHLLPLLHAAHGVLMINGEDKGEVLTAQLQSKVLTPAVSPWSPCFCCMAELALHQHPGWQWQCLSRNKHQAAACPAG